MKKFIFLFLLVSYSLFADVYGTLEMSYFSLHGVVIQNNDFITGVDFDNSFQSDLTLGYNYSIFSVETSFITNFNKYDGVLRFHPLTQGYKIGMFVETKGIKVGWEHYCEHTVVSNRKVDFYFDQGHTRMYAKYNF